MELRLTYMQDYALRLWSHRFTFPAVLVLIGGILLVDMAQQVLAWKELLAEPSLASAPTVPDRTQIDLKQVEMLFGVTVPTRPQPQKTSLPLTLLGSFVSAQAKHSAAVIQVSGKMAKRVAVGQEVTAGVRLEAVFADHIVLIRSGIPEHLFFPRGMAEQSREKRSGYPSFNAAQLRKLPTQPPSRVAAQRLEGLLQGLTRSEGVQ
ncbi:type II secretion system protein N [Pseudomonas sp. KB-10]|uniref:type II secretion system protein N n=1 Tax=Pseudomonas sp. KB-10 TaxID=2292264 RepID=UPI001BB09655|nr:type II secretion system protein N [Pseudomonas sp. KB-10]